MSVSPNEYPCNAPRRQAWLTHSFISIRDSISIFVTVQHTIEAPRVVLIGCHSQRVDPDRDAGECFPREILILQVLVAVQVLGLYEDTSL